MSWGGPEFVLAIIAFSTGGWLINNWIRARHGYALEDEWGGKTDRAENDTATALRRDNAELREKLAHLEDRLKVLERITTDRGVSVAAQIEALRDSHPDGLLLSPQRTGEK